MERYERYKDRGVEWLGEVPEHWNTLRMKYAFNERSQKGFSNEPLLSATQMYGVIPQSLYENRTVVATKGLETLKLVLEGDFIISLRSFQGGLEYAHYRGIISPAYTVLEPKKIDKQYFRYLGKSNIFVQLLKSCVTGIREGQNIDYSVLRENRIPIPPSDEQGRIVAFLDEKCGQIDRAVEQKERMIELLQERRAATIQRAVTQGLGPNIPLKDSNIDWIGKIPTHWQIKKLKYVLEEKNNKQISIECQLNYIGMENVESWTGQYIETDSEVEGLANVFNENNVLFGKLRPYLAKVYLAREKGLCSTEFIVYEILDNNSTYIQRLLSSTNFINIVNASTYGSKMPRANSNFIGNLKIAIPPLSEQSEIAAYLDKVSTKTEQAIKLKRQEIERIKEYRQTLINSAVTGKIKID